jgi:AcrR family transcriptional regulator
MSMSDEVARSAGARVSGGLPPGTGPSVPRTARERARAEITAEILDAGRRHLAIEGGAGLSLRAIARDLGMASSAVYRYVASRDELLTRLIIDAYDSLGAAAEAREGKQDRADLVGRWSAICVAVREWAVTNPNEYALIYGSPVPGYVAPLDTIAPASRVSALLVQILIDAVASGLEVPPRSGREAPPPRGDQVSPAGGGQVLQEGASQASTEGGDQVLAGSGQVLPACRSALAPMRAVMPPEMSDAALQAGLMVWAALFGMVSFELFGQFHNVVGDGPGDREAFFAECVRRWAGQVGIATAAEFSERS